MLKAQIISDFTDRQVVGGELCLRFFDGLVVNVLLRALPRELPEQAAQVFGGNVQGLGDGLNRGQAFCQQVFVVEIIRQHLFQTIQDFAIADFPGDELPFVKTLGVGKQEFQLG